jgi:hypothetical protein
MISKIFVNAKYVISQNKKQTINFFKEETSSDKKPVQKVSV